MANKPPTYLKEVVALLASQLTAARLGVIATFLFGLASVAFWYIDRQEQRAPFSPADTFKVTISDDTAVLKKLRTDEGGIVRVFYCREGGLNMAIIMNSIYGEPVESWSLASIQQNPLVREDFSSYRSNPMEFLIQYFPDLGPEVGVSETLCMRLSPCGFDGSFIEPFGV